MMGKGNTGSHPHLYSYRETKENTNLCEAPRSAFLVSSWDPSCGWALFEDP